MACNDSERDALAVCQHPMGDGHYVPAGDIRDGRCFESGCDCTPRVYVSVDALLNWESLVAAASAIAKRTGYGGTTKADARAIVRAAITAALPGSRRREEP